MQKLVKVVFFVNLLAGIIVLVLSQYVPAFTTTSASDFLFYTVIIIWGVAGLTWGGGTESRNWDMDPAATKTRSMVASHNFESDYQQQQRHNFHFGLMMFIAGLPPLLGCFVLQWF